MRPYPKVPLGGWVETSAGGGWRWGTVDENGRFTLPVNEDARVRIQVAAGPSIFQPCGVTLPAGDRGTRDVHVIDDLAQLGAHVPPQLLAQTETLSGLVFERGDNGRRIPLDGVRLVLDALSGFELFVASTLTDAEGRYIFCGLEGEASTYVWASKSTHQIFQQGVQLTGRTTFDIEMRR